MNTPLIQVHSLSKRFVVKKGYTQAFSDLSFSISTKETLGLIGESGSGKSSLGKCLLRLEEPTSGTVHFENQDILQFSKKQLFTFRRKAQIILQDPYSSLNPKMTAAQAIMEPLQIHYKHTKEVNHQLAYEAFMRVGLHASSFNRFPFEFSGGQRQRIAIARALILNPAFIVCDEPISALDISTQAQIITLLKKIQEELQIGYLFIAHNLNMVRHISHRVAVMYSGDFVELAQTEELYQNPLHPYTQALFATLPDSSFRKAKPSLGVSSFSGCPFAARCPYATKVCEKEKPEWKEKHSGHFVACHLNL